MGIKVSSVMVKIIYCGGNAWNSISTSHYAFIKQRLIFNSILELVFLSSYQITPHSSHPVFLHLLICLSFFYVDAAKYNGEFQRFSKMCG